jgi:hypothetical protein
MTRMSDHGCPIEAEMPRNHAGSLGRSPMAQAVHGWWPVVSHVLPVLVLVGACVPSLSVDNQDAGINSPPAILAVRNDQQELTQPGPVLLERGVPATVNMSLIDTDIDDTLYVRIFVDYSIAVPTPARSTCTATGDTATRTATCDVSAVCTPSDVGADRTMTIYVFDRMLLDSGTPMFQAMGPGGLTTNRAYDLKCTEPTP